MSYLSDSFDVLVELLELLDVNLAVHALVVLSEQGANLVLRHLGTHRLTNNEQ